jgi:hypothetical protein
MISISMALGTEEERRTLQGSEVCLLVKLSRLETERVDNVVDLLLAILDTLLSLFGRCVGTGVYMYISLYSSIGVVGSREGTY